MNNAFYNRHIGLLIYNSFGALFPLCNGIRILSTIVHGTDTPDEQCKLAVYIRNKLNK